MLVLSSSCSRPYSSGEGRKKPLQVRSSSKLACNACTGSSHGPPGVWIVDEFVYCQEAAFCTRSPCARLGAGPSRTRPSSTRLVHQEVT